MYKKNQPYTLIRQVTQQECHWLERTYEIDNIVFRFYDPTYKCIGQNGWVFCDAIDTSPFFELPNDAVSIM